MTRDDLQRQMRETITLQKVIGRDVDLAAWTCPTTRCGSSTSGARSSSTRSRNRRTWPRSSSSSRPNDAEARQQAAAKVEEIRGKIKGGAAFADLAKEISEGNTKDRGGELGTVTKGELVEALDAAIFVEPGRVSRAGAACPTRSTSSTSPTARPPASSPSPRSRTTCASGSPTSSTRSASPSTWTSCAARPSSRSTMPELAKLDEKKAELRSSQRPPLIAPRCSSRLRLPDFSFDARRALARLVRPAAVLLRRGARRR